MNISVPVTDYIPASILTTLNDIVVRGAAIPARQAALLRAIGLYSGTFTQTDETDLVVTGVGFRPSVVLFVAIDNTETNLNWSIGWDFDTSQCVLYQYENGTSMGRTVNYSVFIQQSAGNNIFGSLDSLDADGFTFGWNQGGAVQCQGMYLALP